MLFGNNGILNSAKIASQDNVIASEEEAISIAWSSLILEQYANSGFEINTSTLENQLKSDGYDVSVTTDDDGNFVVTFKKTGHAYTVDTNGKILSLDGVDIVDDESNADFVIKNVETLAQFRNMINDGDTFSGETVKVTADIDFGNGNTENWVPIGNNITQFEGTFDGQGHTISNLYISTANHFQGLFGVVGSNGIVKNVIVSGNIASAGDAVGRNNGSKFWNSRKMWQFSYCIM